jgi:hypothetical protein
MPAANCNKRHYSHYTAMWMPCSLKKIETQVIMYSELYLPTPYFFDLVGVHILANTYSSTILVYHPLYFTGKSITLNILLA